MITEFIGEFMFHPAALEVSGNTCSHNCCYCFANIRKSSRVVNTRAIIRQINKTKEKTYQDALINAGFAICLSNKTDPFSQNNYQHTLALAREMNKLKNPIFIQTKGGYGIDEFLNISKNKKVFYVTITTLDETIRQRIEPNAPTVNERIELVRMLHNKGYLIIVAINPIYEGWMPKNMLYEFMDIMKKIGIRHICTEALHLNKREVQTFSTKRLQSFTEEEIKYSTQRYEFQNYVKEIIPIIQNEGFHVMKLGMPYKSEFFYEIRAELGKIFPNHYDIINYCHDNYKSHIVTFKEYYEKTVDDKIFFERKFKYTNKYILRANIREWAIDHKAKEANTLKEAMRWIWNNPKVALSISRNQAYRIVVNEREEIIKDKNGDIMLYFDKGIYPSQRIINVKFCKDEKL